MTHMTKSIHICLKQLKMKGKRLHLFLKRTKTLILWTVHYVKLLKQKTMLKIHMNLNLLNMLVSSKKMFYKDWNIMSKSIKTKRKLKKSQQKSKNNKLQSNNWDKNLKLTKFRKNCSKKWKCKEDYLQISFKDFKLTNAKKYLEQQNMIF